MGLTEKFQKFVEYFKKAEESPEVLVGTSSALPDDSLNDADLSLHVVYDYASVKAIATHASSIEIVAMEMTDGVPSPAGYDHPANKLLRRPNDKMTWGELVEAYVFYRELYGHCPMHLGRTAPDKPDLVTSFYPVRPDRLEIEAESKGSVTKYRFTDFNERSNDEIIPAKDIVVIRHFNPLHPVWGRTPATSAHQALLLDWHAHKYNVSFFGNHAMPGVILQTNKNLNAGQKKQLRAGWRAAFGGSSRAHGVAICSAGLEVKTITATHKDIEFAVLMKQTMQEILAARGVPPLMVMQMEGATAENSQEQEHIFLSGALRPALNRLLDSLNIHVFNPLGINLVANYETFQTSAKTLHERKQEFRGYWRDGITTRDETRKLLGMAPAKKGGEEYIADMQLGGVGPTGANKGQKQLPGPDNKPDSNPSGTDPKQNSSSDNTPEI
jgi:HK97 family phage portal protein